MRLAGDLGLENCRDEVRDLASMKLERRSKTLKAAVELAGSSDSAVEECKKRTSSKLARRISHNNSEPDRKLESAARTSDA